MKIAFISSESEPFVKTGGLGELSYAYLNALDNQNQTIIQCLPYYKSIKQQTERFNIKPSAITFEVQIMNKPVECEIFETQIKNRKVYLIGNDEYYFRDYLYSDGNIEYIDNAERFIFFNQAFLHLLKELKFEPDIIHCVDWQTSLIPVYLKTIYQDDFPAARSLLTVNNILYQGVYSQFEMPLTNLPWSLFTPDKLEYYGKINFLKGGILYADAISVTSPHYRQEILTREYGAGLQDVLRTREDKLFAIINGIDGNVWNSHTDQELLHPYTQDSLITKRANRKKISDQLGFDHDEFLLCAVVMRMTREKGVDFLLEMMDWFLQKNINLIIIGAGDHEFEKLVDQRCGQNPTRTRYFPSQTNSFMHRLFASSDLLLKPSRLEPGGLSHLYAMRYGTLPIVSRVGGLIDTILDIFELPDSGTGFVFESGNALDFIFKTEKIIDWFFTEPIKWTQWQKNAMNHRYLWENTVSQYIQLYQNILKQE